jgi:hypothetical protein
MAKQDAGETSCHTDLCDVVTKMIAIITMNTLSCTPNSCHRLPVLSGPTLCTRR